MQKVTEIQNNLQVIDTESRRKWLKKMKEKAENETRNWRKQCDRLYTISYYFCIHVFNYHV